MEKEVWLVRVRMEESMEAFPKRSKLEELKLVLSMNSSAEAELKKRSACIWMKKIKINVEEDIEEEEEVMNIHEGGRRVLKS